MLLSMKTVLLSVPAMPKELWHLSETLSSVFSDGYNVPPSLKPSELLPTNLLSFSDSFVFDTPKLFFSCLISCIPPKPQRFPCQNPPFLCHFSSFSPVCPFLSPSALPAYSSRSYYAPRFLDFDVTLLPIHRHLLFAEAIGKIMSSLFLIIFPNKVAPTLPRSRSMTGVVGIRRGTSS